MSLTRNLFERTLNTLCQFTVRSYAAAPDLTNSWHALDSDSDLFFRQSIIENDESIEKKIKSHQLLSEAKSRLEKYFQKRREKADYAVFLETLIAKITNQLGFTLFEVDDNSEVGVIFEVMNDRGKQLSQLEKVKNFLLYFSNRVSIDVDAASQLSDHINHSWKEILQNLSLADKSKNEDEDYFLKLNFIVNFFSELKAIKDEHGRNISISSQLADLNKLIKNHFKNISDKNFTYEKIREYVDSLVEDSCKFKYFCMPFDSTSFQDIETPHKEHMREIASELNRLDISNLMPVLVAIYKRFYKNPELLLNLLSLCERFFFRMYYIAGHRFYKKQYLLYSFANKLYTKEIDHADLISELVKLIEKYCPHKKIRESLTEIEETDYYDWDGLIYFLFEYERSRCCYEKITRPAYEWEDIKKRGREESIEHILPKKLYPTDPNSAYLVYWTSRFDEKSHEKNQCRLGNLTLTTSNPKLGRKPFDEKKQIYMESKFLIEKDLIKFSEWTEKEISEREEQLIDFANKRWSIKKYL